NNNGEGSSRDEENSIDKFLNLEKNVENNQENEFYEANQLSYINDWN
ncbi:4938_t:CDS:1, partial [Ambispora leptoticha]